MLTDLGTSGTVLFFNIVCVMHLKQFQQKNLVICVDRQKAYGEKEKNIEKPVPVPSTYNRQRF